MSLRIFGKEIPPSNREKRPKTDVPAAAEPVELEADVEAEEEEAIVDDIDVTPPEVVVVQAF